MYKCFFCSVLNFRSGTKSCRQCVHGYCNIFPIRIGWRWIPIIIIYTCYAKCSIRICLPIHIGAPIYRHAGSWEHYTNPHITTYWVPTCCCQINRRCKYCSRGGWLNPEDHIMLISRRITGVMTGKIISGMCICIMRNNKRNNNNQYYCFNITPLSWNMQSRSAYSSIHRNTPY